ncbi:MAG TPA: UDP-3-O-(3-hydroxymyristoyl)glucosamine N-acyltransferase [Rhabdochlamydiaceae bacterium]|nr:UDP-3-O-(3-hydroxymyristoyl)glucosamine N-acyltransferase [Rhabdochlamydiaceae bacterium]
MNQKRNKTFTLKQLSELTEAEIKGDPNYIITGVNDLDSAQSEDLSFLANPRYISAMRASKAGIVCAQKEMATVGGKNFLISDNPSKTFQMIVELFFPQTSLTGFKGIHPTAVVHESAILEKGVHIGPYAVIDQGVKIGSNTHVGAFVFIGQDTTVGEECLLHPHSIVREHCSLGNRVILQPGAVVGSCGFGYVTNEKGNHVKLEQLGTVIIEDDVEIGANTTIDRARFKTTKISKGSKIDNLVQIAHNVEIGPYNLIAAQTGIAGSAKTGKYVFMGGQAGVVGHLEIADGVMIATRGGVSKTLKTSGKYAGGPVMALSEYNRQQVYLRKIHEYVEKIDELEKRINNIESFNSKQIDD